MTAIRPYVPPPPPAPAFAVRHHVHGYFYYRFPDYDAARQWAVIHGYQVDGQVTEDFCRRMRIVPASPPLERPPSERST